MHPLYAYKITIYPHTGTLTTLTYQQSPVHWPSYLVYVWLGTGYCGRTTTWPSWVSSLHATTFDPSEDLAGTDWVLPTTSTALLWHWVPPRAVSVVIITWLELPYAWMISKPHLSFKKASLDVVQSRPLDRHVLTNVRSHNTVLGWPGVWDCSLMQYHYICPNVFTRTEHQKRYLAVLALLLYEQ